MVTIAEMSLCRRILKILYVFSRRNIYLKRQNQTEQRSENERVQDGLVSPYSHHTSHGESQQHRCENIYNRFEFLISL